ncbi:MAG: hypothetical protein HY784_19460 [Chloroflexi bacterium]|nr:hypothetical protein [Chloroflexota bacterium]
MDATPPIDELAPEAASAPPEARPEAPAPRPLLSPRAKRLLWQGRYRDAFWRSATLFSFVINLVLLTVVIVLALWLFDIKSTVVGPLVEQLHTSFVEMDQAHIRTVIQVVDTIQVSDTIHLKDQLPVAFDLPLATDTQVILTQDTPVKNAIIYLNEQPVPLDIVLRAGTPLNIKLGLTVPVSQTVPVELDVPVRLQVPISLPVSVDIPLADTELHEPFARLEQAVGPYDSLLSEIPNTWDQALCKYARLCIFLP